ncbi:hypothetical protein SJAV_00210 [Sulfurisphaera javensis]|uniref:Transposase n=1 Tax=Sulfurisphaera javensis TaxID=2049879 RepID=A0AAT9GMH5_9CREN
MSLWFQERSVINLSVKNFAYLYKEGIKGYWRLLAKVWKRFNFMFVVADMIKSVHSALELSGINARRQLCLNHVKRRLDRSGRDEVDLLVSGLLTEFSDKVKGLVERGLSRSSLCLKNFSVFSLLIIWWSRLIPWWRFSKYHTPYRLQIVWAIAQNYNILDNFL